MSKYKRPKCIKSLLIYKVRKNARITIHAADLAVNTVIDALIESISKGERIEIRGFGSFRIKTVKPRISAVAGDIVPIHDKIVFKPCKSLRDTVWKNGEPVRH